MIVGLQSHFFYLASARDALYNSSGKALAIDPSGNSGNLRMPRPRGSAPISAPRSSSIPWVMNCSSSEPLASIFRSVNTYPRVAGSPIARRVLLARGRVLAMRREGIPGGDPAAAILRYPV